MYTNRYIQDVPGGMCQTSRESSKIAFVLYVQGNDLQTFIAIDTLIKFAVGDYQLIVHCEMGRVVICHHGACLGRLEIIYFIHCSHFVVLW